MIQEFVEENEAVKPGTIAIWNDEQSLPNGWGYCDGNNDTPDLRGKMVKSVPDSNTDPGASGGVDSYSLEKSQLPPHTHTGTTDTTGDHYHTKGTGNAFSTGDGRVFDSTDGSGVKLFDSGDHSHTLSIDNTGSGSSINNLPEYKETTFIMKL